MNQHQFQDLLQELPQCLSSNTAHLILPLIKQLYSSNFRLEITRYADNVFQKAQDYLLGYFVSNGINEHVAEHAAITVAALGKKYQYDLSKGIKSQNSARHDKSHTRRGQNRMIQQTPIGSAVDDRSYLRYQSLKPNSLRTAMDMDNYDIIPAKLSIRCEELMAMLEPEQALCGVYHMDTGYVDALPYYANPDYGDERGTAGLYARTRHPMVSQIDESERLARHQQALLQQETFSQAYTCFDVLPHDNELQYLYGVEDASLKNLQARTPNGHMQVAALQGLDHNKPNNYFHHSKYLGFTIRCFDKIENNKSRRIYELVSQSRLLNSTKFAGEHSSDGGMTEKWSETLMEGIMTSAQVLSRRRHETLLHLVGLLEETKYQLQANWSQASFQVLNKLQAQLQNCQTRYDFIDKLHQAKSYYPCARNMIQALQTRCLQYLAEEANHLQQERTIINKRRIRFSYP